MICPSCQAPNPAGAKFCSNCGTPLVMDCRNCGTRLNARAKFCHNCGYPVLSAQENLTQPEASEAVAPPDTADPSSSFAQYIPRELLSKLQSARARSGNQGARPFAERSMPGERRIVTVLFCDVKGSTALAEQLDPEEWAEIMNGAFKHLIAPVYKYEGTLARLMGDAILAFFGAPIAHEDDPQRAVLAGLEIVEGIKPYREEVEREHGFTLDVRVGINTGLVVVGEVGSDLRVEYTAMGDAVNLASRMEQSAAPGSVQITGNTYRSIHNLFNFVPLGEIEVKGKSERVAAYRVTSAREDAVPARGIEGLRSPLVGREGELQTLISCLSELRAGRGQVISIMGEAGLGKSRLAAEARKSVDPASWGTDFEWHEGRSLSYETTTPYAPINDLLKSFFRLSAQDDHAAKNGPQNGYGKIHAAVETLLPGQGEELSPFLASPMGISLEGDALQRVMYFEPPMLRARVANAISIYVEALASRTPTLLLFEDLHWADNSSLEMLEGLLPVTDRAPLLLMALFRPHPGEPSWRFHEAASREYPHRYTQITLQPLDSTGARQLVANLLDIEDLPEKVRELILSKAEGNPFYVEEVIRSLLDDGLVVRESGHWRATREIEKIAVPDTLAGVITARLDRLDDEAKMVAQTAAVIGRDFRFDVLREVYGSVPGLENAVTTLQKRELVRERSTGSLSGPGSLSGQRTLTFKHVLTQETAYASLLMSKRRELHLRVAEHLEKLMPPEGVMPTGGAEPDYVHDISRHFMEAREHARALPYLVEAGSRAAATFARDEALAFFRQAISVVQTVTPPEGERAPEGEGALPEARRAYEGLGKILEYSMDVPGATATYREMFDYADKRGDVPMKVSALNKLSYVNAFMMGRFPEAEASLHDAEELAAGADDTAGLAETYTVFCGICTATADFTNAERYLTEAAEAGRKLDQKRLTAYGLAHKSQTLTFLAQFDAAWETAQEGLRVAEEANDFERRSEILTMAVPYYHMVQGDLDSARQALEEGYELGVKIGLMIPPVIGAMLLATVAQMRGEYEQALEWHERSLAAARPIAAIFPFMLAIPLGTIGAACIEVSEGLAERAQGYHRELLEILQTPSGAPAGGISWTDLGFCALALGEIDYARIYFENALSSPSMHMYLQKPRMLAGSALVALKEGRFDDAGTLAQQGCRDAEERRMKQMYPLVYITRGEVCMARGEIKEALEHFMRAEVDAAQMMMRPSLWQAQAGYARALEAQGHLDEAAAKRHQALQTIGTISSLFRDEVLCSMFTAGAMKKLERSSTFESKK